MTRNLPLLALLLACAPAAAQDAVHHPATAGMAGERITARTETLEFASAADRGWETLGDMTLRTVLATVDGREAVVRTETTRIDGEVVQVDSFALDRRTLAAIVLRSDGVEASQSLHFGATEVLVVDDGDWGADSARYQVPGPVFLANSTDLLLAALPLAEGFTTRLAVYDPEVGLDTMAVRVEAAEELALPSGARAAVWRVWTSSNLTAGWYWMDRESRTLVQYQTGSGTTRLIRAAPGRGRTRTASLNLSDRP